LEDDIAQTIEIDNILSKTGIQFEVGTLEESICPSSYQSEIKQTRLVIPPTAKITAHYP
jgi:hypothetical protein